MKLTVFVHPNSKNPRIEADLLDVLHVYVKEPPLEGKANNAIVKALAAHLHVKKSQIVLIRGEKSKKKVFEILSPH